MKVYSNLFVYRLNAYHELAETRNLLFVSPGLQKKNEDIMSEFKTMLKLINFGIHVMYGFSLLFI